jgi:hypothetical protein
MFLTISYIPLVLPEMVRMARTMAIGRGGIGRGLSHLRTPKCGDR